MELNLPLQHNYEVVPEIPVAAINRQNGRRIEFRAIVDTGADGTLLDDRIAEALGIDLSRAPQALVGGVGGLIPDAKSSEVEIELMGQPDSRVILRVTFAPNVASSFGNLLGLNLLESFDFGLVHSTRRLAMGRTS